MHVDVVFSCADITDIQGIPIGRQGGGEGQFAFPCIRIQAKQSFQSRLYDHGFRPALISTDPGWFVNGAIHDFLHVPKGPGMVNVQVVHQELKALG